MTSRLKSFVNECDWLQLWQCNEAEYETMLQQVLCTWH